MRVRPYIESASPRTSNREWLMQRCQMNPHLVPKQDNYGPKLTYPAASFDNAAKKLTELFDGFDIQNFEIYGFDIASHCRYQMLACVNEPFDDTI